MLLAFAIGQLQQREPGRGGGIPFERQALLRNNRTTACRQAPLISSKPVSDAPKPARARDSSSTASSMPLSVSSAVQDATGRGYSFSVAAVIMPNVPSLPIYRSRRS